MSTLTVGELVAYLDLDANPFTKNLDRAMRHAESQGDRMKRVGDRMSLGLTAPILLAFTKMTGSASDLNETVSQSEQIFGTATSRIGNFAQTAAAKFGQSERAAHDAANTFGLFFINAGKSKVEAADMSIELTKLASDAASFKNTSVDQAVEAFGAALRGESEPIRQYGVMLDDATLKQRALNMGLVDSATGVLPPAIRMQAAYAEILAQTSTIQGDFERTADGLANKQRILSAELENTSAKLGDKLIPFAIRGADAASFMVDTFAALPPELQTAVVGFAALLAASGPLLSVGGRMVTAWGKLADHIAATASPQTYAAFTAMSRGAAAAGIAVGGLTAAYALFKAAAQSQRDDVAAMFPEWEAALDLGNATYTELTKRIGNIGDEIDRVNGIIEGSSAPWDADKRQGLTEGREELERLADAAQTMKDRADQLSAQLGISDQAALEMAQSETVMGEAVDETTGLLDVQRAATQANVEELEKLANALTAQFDPLFRARDSLGRLAEAQTAASEAVAEYGEGSAEAVEANQAAVEAALTYESAMVNLKAAVERGDVSVDGSIATLQSWVAQGVITQTQADEAAWSIATLGGQARDLDGSSVLVTVVADTTTAEGRIAALKHSLATVPTTVPVGFIGPLLPNQQRAPGPVQVRDHGGPVLGARGTPQMVLAHGGEVVLPTHRMGLGDALQQTLGIPSENRSIPGRNIEHLEMVVQTQDSPRQWFDEGLWRVTNQ